MNTAGEQGSMSINDPILEREKIDSPRRSRKMLYFYNKRESTELHRTYILTYVVFVHVILLFSPIDMDDHDTQALYLE